MPSSPSFLDVDKNTLINFNIVLEYDSDNVRDDDEHWLPCCFPGDMERLQKFWLSGACTSKTEDGESSQPLGILNFTSAFILLAGGMLLGGLLLLLEHIYFKFFRRKLRKWDRCGCCGLVSLVRVSVLKLAYFFKMHFLYMHSFFRFYLFFVQDSDVLIHWATKIAIDLSVVHSTSVAWHQVLTLFQLSCIPFWNIHFILSWEQCPLQSFEGLLKFYLSTSLPRIKFRKSVSFFHISVLFCFFYISVDWKIFCIYFYILLLKFDTLH